MGFDQVMLPYALLLNKPMQYEELREECSFRSSITRSVKCIRSTSTPITQIRTECDIYNKSESSSSSTSTLIIISSDCFQDSFMLLSS